MLEHYAGWIDQVSSALETWGSTRLSGEYRVLHVAGMGGSGVVGDYLASLSLVYGGLPVVVHKSHVAPRRVFDDDLFIVISYSGNTVETIRFLENIVGRVETVIVSSDGFLEKYALEKNLVFVKTLPGLVPRTALPHMLFSILGLLDSSGLTIVSRSEALDTYRFMKESVEAARREAEGVARFIYEGKGLLLIATHTPYEPLGVRGKNEFNENSKILVKVEVAPEWMHNDIVGWEKPFENSFSALLVFDGDDRVGSSLVDYMSGVYRDNDIPVYRLELKGGSFLDKLMYGSMVLGMASVVLAGLRGVDPLVTKSIVEYKSVVRELFG